MSRGLFVVLEGIDHSGKTTLAAMLATALASAGRQVLPMRFPDYTLASGAELKAYLLSRLDLDAAAAHTLFVANRAEAAAAIREAVAAGKFVVCDRYVHSGVAYSVAKGLDLDECFRLEAHLPRPDATFHLDITPQESEKRGFDGQRHDDVAFLQLVRDAYAAIRARDATGTVHRVDTAEHSPDAALFYILERLAGSYRTMSTELGRIEE